METLLPLSWDHPLVLPPRRFTISPYQFFHNWISLILSEKNQPLGTSLFSRLERSKIGIRVHAGNVGVGDHALSRRPPEDYLPWALQFRHHRERQIHILPYESSLALGSSVSLRAAPDYAALELGIEILSWKIAQCREFSIHDDETVLKVLHILGKTGQLLVLKADQGPDDGKGDPGVVCYAHGQIDAPGTRRTLRASSHPCKGLHCYSLHGQTFDPIGDLLEVRGHDPEIPPVVPVAEDGVSLGVVLQMLGKIDEECTASRPRSSHIQPVGHPFFSIITPPDRIHGKTYIFRLISELRR